ncbi:MAG: ATP synthase F1 subunit delta [Chitinophagales bacterium]|nr:ATP synthase F1 subunit delta [Chitinophagales bacterium]
MSVDKLARRYVKAFFDESMSKNNVEQVNQDMELVNQATSSSRDLRVFLSNPIIKSNVKMSALKEIFSDKISSDTYALIQLLINNNRIGNLGDVARLFKDYYNEHKNILEVTVTTATALDKATEELVVKTIHSKVGEKEIIIHPIVDKSILGGFIIDLGNKIYDLSVRNRLSNIANQLIYN